MLASLSNLFHSFFILGGNRYLWSPTTKIFTPVSATAIVQFTPLSGRRGRVWQVIVTGAGTTSAAQQLVLGRPAAIGITPATNVAPDKWDHDQEPAAAFNYYTTFGTQPTAPANSIVLGFNALGGTAIWNAPAQTGKLETVGGTDAIVLIGAASGITYQACSVSIIFEED